MPLFQSHAGSEKERLLQRTAYARISQIDVLDYENPPDSWCNLITRNIRCFGSKIVDYNSSFVMSFGWLYPLRGGIISFEVLFQLLLANIITYSFAFFKCHDGQHMIHDTCVPLMSTSTYTDMLTLVILMLLVLVILLFAVFTRWWNIRQYMNSVIGHHDSLVAVLAAQISESTNTLRNHTKENAVKSANTLLRQINLACLMIYYSINKINTYDSLLERGLLMPDEELHLKIIKNPAAVFSWAIIQLDKMKIAGILDECYATNCIFNDIQNMMKSCQSVLSASDVTLPCSYIQFVGMISNITTMTIVYTCGAILGDAFADDYNLSLLIFGFASMNICMLINICLSKLVFVFENPLNDGSFGFSQEYYMARLEKDTKVIFDGVYNAISQGIVKSVRK